MEGQLHAQRVSNSPWQENCEAVPALESNWSGQACQFINDFQRLMGDDFEPDPLFFVECWTLDTPTAARNFQQRRRRPAERERPCYMTRDSYTPSTLAFSQQCDSAAKFSSSVSAAAGAGRDYTDWCRQPSQSSSRWTQDQNPPQEEGFAEACDSRQQAVYPMTEQNACQLLGVTANSTLEQIKAAYRRLASQWHPDRLELRTERVRRLATEQMAAINEAYHLLRSCLVEKTC
jgi:hypothetical protein